MALNLDAIGKKIGPFTKEYRCGRLRSYTQPNPKAQQPFCGGTDELARPAAARWAQIASK